MAIAPLSAGFQSLPPLPTSKVGPSGADSHVGGFVYILGPCGSLQWTLLQGWEFLPLLPQPPRGFQSEVWGFISPSWSRGNAWSILLPLCSSRFICAWMWDCRVHQPLPCGIHQLLPCPPRFTISCLAGSSSHHFAVSPLCPAVCLRPSYWSDECFFFNSLVFRLPYSLILSVLVVFCF